MTENIFLFVPNIIDYFRLIFAFMAFYYMPSDYVKTAIFYIISVTLDEFDGRAARKLNQGSKLGSILDQIIDRMTNVGLYCVLCHFYPTYMFCFQFLMVLDIFSHWLLMHSTEMQGKDSHKIIDRSANPLLRLYYDSTMFSTILSVATEIFLITLYLLHFTPGPVLTVGKMSVGLFQAILYLCAPLALLKVFVNVLQLMAAAQSIAFIDQQKRARAAAEKAQ